MAEDFASLVLNAPKQEREDFAGEILRGQSEQPPEKTQTAEPEADSGLGVAESFVSPLVQFVFGMEGRKIKLGQGVVNVKNGLVQTGMEVLERAGIFPEGSTDEFTRMTNEERKRVEKAFKEEFGESAQFAVSELSGMLIPYLIIPAAGKTALQRIFFGMLTGGGAAGTQFRPEETAEERGAARTQATAVGAGVGAGVSAGSEVIQQTRHFITNRLAEAIARNREFAARGLDVQKRTGVKFKLSQLIDDPSVNMLEDMARVGSAGERNARLLETRQSIDALKYWRRAARKIAPKTPFAEKVRGMFDDIIGSADEGTGLLGRRAQQARADFAAAEKAGGTVPLGRTLNTMDDLIEEFSSPGAGKQSRRLAQELAEIKEDIIERGGGALSPLQIQKRLEEWGRAAKGSGKLFTDKVDRAAELRPARSIFRALNEDLDEAIAAGGRGAEALKRARDRYALNTAEIREVEDSALGKLFGKGRDSSINDIERAFLKMKAPEIRATMDILKKSDPLAQRRLQRFWVEKAIEAAKGKGPADSIQFIPAKLADIKKDADVYNAVFNDQKSRQLVGDGIEAVRRIMMNNLRTGGRTVPRLNQFMQAMRNRSAGAAAQGVLTDFFAPNLIAKYIIDPRGVQALQKLHQPANQNTLAAAAAVLANIATSE